MKKIISIVLSVYLLNNVSVFAQSEITSSQSFYGEKINAEGAISTSELDSLVKDQGSVETIKLKGDISAACQVKGCWMTLSREGSKDIRVTFKDYGFFVPTDAAGSTAIVEGEAKLDTISVDVLRHYAVDGGMSAEEAEKTITKPEVSVSVVAKGVIIE